MSDNHAAANSSRPRRPHGPMGRMAPGEKPKDFKGTLRKLLSYAARFKVAIAAVLVFAIASTAFSIVGPKILSEATTELFNGIVSKIDGTGFIDFERISQILFVTIALYLVSALCSFSQGWIMSSVSQRLCYTLRRDIAEKIDRMPFGYFERNSIGDVLSRITNDVDTLGHTLGQGLTQLVTSVVTLVGVLAMMISINPLMTLVTVVILPVSAVLVAVVVKRSQKYFTAQQELLGAINGQVEETFSGHTVVRAFCQEEKVLRRFNETNDQLRESVWKAQFVSGLMRPVMEFVGNLGYVAVAIMGSVFAVQGVITVGDIQAFIQYVKNFTQPVTQLAQVSNVLQQMAASAERIFEFLAEPEEEETAGVEGASVAEAVDSVSATMDGALSSGLACCASGAGCDVKFDHVRFGYDPDVPVINDFCAHVLPGQTVAIVGPTGAGKTTLVKLLMRFYDVQGGGIRLGGVDVREISRRDLRSQFGMVLQDTWLFNGTIRENIRYGKLDATDEEVEAAARAGSAHHFIQTLPGGYDFVINEDATNISQGQRQLLTIARAILADRRMLILDEATSSVDTRTEERIQRAMDHLMEGRTSFVIAHRLSTVRDADLILVMDHGDIVEQGTHEELLALGGFYADLYNSQFECS